MCSGTHYPREAEQRARGSSGWMARRLRPLRIPVLSSQESTANYLLHLFRQAFVLINGAKFFHRICLDCPGNPITIFREIASFSSCDSDLKHSSASWIWVSVYSASAPGRFNINRSNAAKCFRSNRSIQSIAPVKVKVCPSPINDWHKVVNTRRRFHTRQYFGYWFCSFRSGRSLTTVLDRFRNWDRFHNAPRQSRVLNNLLSFFDITLFQTAPVGTVQGCDNSRAPAIFISARVTGSDGPYQRQVSSSPNFPVKPSAISL